MQFNILSTFLFNTFPEIIDELVMSIYLIIISGMMSKYNEYLHFIYHISKENSQTNSYSNLRISEYNKSSNYKGR